MLLPVDLLDVVRRPNIFPGAPHEEIARRLEIAGKLLILQAQMTWILGNLPGCRPATEIFSAQLRTPAPVTGFRPATSSTPRAIEDDIETVLGEMPRTLEAWILTQQGDEDFENMLQEIDDRALQHDLWIRAPVNENPASIVPLSFQEIIVRDTHHRMFHLASAKVYAILRRSYFWKSMKTDVRKILDNCPQCEMNKARQNTAHGLFSALPAHVPRSK